MKRAILIPSMVLVIIALLTACGGTNTTPPTPSPLPPTATSNPPTATMPPPTATPPPTPSSTPEETGLEEQKFSFVAPLGTQEEDERIRHGLVEIPGIKKATVNEISVVVIYDPDAITIEKIQEAIEVLGYQVKPQN